MHVIRDQKCPTGPHSNHPCLPWSRFFPPGEGWIAGVLGAKMQTELAKRDSCTLGDEFGDLSCEGLRLGKSDSFRQRKMHWQGIKATSSIFELGC